jgi:hypothetical protein
MRILSVEGFVKLDSPGTVFIRRREPDEVLVTTGTGLTLSEGWHGGNSPRVEVQTLDEQWIDITPRCTGGSIPADVVREWSHLNERTLIDFRLSR